ncbi:Uncharacterised protein [Mycobacteroides abscessus subsp. abscessus]|nr:Uncharacterised protein [Mycobacteroides abscessus subsp. abscessus]
MTYEFGVGPRALRQFARTFFQVAQGNLIRLSGNPFGDGAEVVGEIVRRLHVAFCPSVSSDLARLAIIGTRCTAGRPSATPK